MTNALPTIDLAPLDNDDRHLSDVAARIGAACRDVGFFYLGNHGVGSELMKRAFAQSQRFFALPLAEKRALAIDSIGGSIPASWARPSTPRRAQT